jgi:hypothetical protein
MAQKSGGSIDPPIAIPTNPHELIATAKIAIVGYQKCARELYANTTF